MSKFKYPLRYIFPISRAHPSIYLALTPLYEGGPIFNLGWTSFSLQFRGIYSVTGNTNSKAEQFVPSWERATYVSGCICKYAYNFKCCPLPIAIDEEGGGGANSVNNGGVGKWTSHATPEDLSTLLITLPKKFLHWACWPLLHSWLKVYQIISFFALSGWMCLGSFIVAILFDGFQFKICKTKSMLFNIYRTNQL